MESLQQHILENEKEESATTRWPESVDFLMQQYPESTAFVCKRI